MRGRVLSTMPPPTHMALPFYNAHKGPSCGYATDGAAIVTTLLIKLTLRSRPGRPILRLALPMSHQTVQFFLAAE